MTYRSESDPVPLLGVEEVERDTQGKKVVDAWLVLEGRHGPTPARRVVSIETRDGAVYRFQRYGRDEYLAFYNRENPDGSRFQRAASLPEHVEAVRTAIMNREVLPDFEKALEAEVQVGERTADDVDEATDQEVREAVENAEAALVADGGAVGRGERLRERVASLRSGYAPSFLGGDSQ
ncbi:ORF 49 [Haloarcula hispanica virus SH1]|uniref:ORF 49 n=1 Tax=Haloarcula hispanica SH1 virus TaxID=326574 RepID=Q4KPD8_9VIRU|nr:ORF 49 [Haloarcula hispanica virus SH1]AAY24975.1 ORF 49 [Haloarcula hispanica virus SH1]